MSVGSCLSFSFACSRPTLFHFLQIRSIHQTHVPCLFHIIPEKSCYSQSRWQCCHALSRQQVCFIWHEVTRSACLAVCLPVVAFCFLPSLAVLVLLHPQARERILPNYKRREHKRLINADKNVIFPELGEVQMFHDFTCLVIPVLWYISSLWRININTPETKELLLEFQLTHFILSKVLCIRSASCPLSSFCSTLLPDFLHALRKLVSSRLLWWFLWRLSLSWLLGFQCLCLFCSVFWLLSCFACLSLLCSMLSFLSLFSFLCSLCCLDTCFLSCLTCLFLSFL